MRIQLLDPLLANQIAAGEVVERPASVVKELLENSIDGGAQKIEIDVEKGGVLLLRIRDDGNGIHKEDLALALQRHATSKIRELHDLEHVCTLGFRGEALASIAAVSRMQISSCLRGESRAWQVSCEGHDTGMTLTPVPHPLGTTVEVRDLFFNTPARRRFLRNEKTEFDHIHELVKRIALSRFEVAFILRHNQRVVYQLQAATTAAARQERIAKLCGKHFIDSALLIDLAHAGLRVRGWLGLPSLARNQADLQYFYVNGRLIKDRVINHALRQVYAEHLYPGKHASYVLYLELEPSAVDVNVHPTKHEVRFHEARLVHDFLQGSLRDALQTGAQDSASTGMLDAEGITQVTAPVTFDLAAHAHATPVSYAPVTRDEKLPLFPPQATLPRVQEQMTVYQALHTGKTSNAFSPRHTDELSAPLGRALRQIDERFLLAENQQGLLLIDIPAAWQAVTLLRWQQGLAEQGIRSQPLLVPLRLALSPAQVALVTQQASCLQRLGIVLQQTAEPTLTVRQIPSLLSNTDVTVWLDALLAQLAAQEGEPDAATMTRLVMTMSRHAVHTATQKMSMAQLDHLLRELEALEDAAPYYRQLTATCLAVLFG